MKRFLIAICSEVMLLSVTAQAQENKFLSSEWWKTATVSDIQNKIKNGADVNAKNEYGDKRKRNSFKSTKQAKPEEK